MKVTNKNINKILDEYKKYEEEFMQRKINIGEYFYYLKKEVGHGSFQKTVKDRFPKISKRTIQRYMNAYKESIGE